MKRRACTVALWLAIVVVIANIAFVIKDSFYYNLENLPTGTPIPYIVDEQGAIYSFSDQKYLFDQEKGGYYIRFYEVIADGKQGIRAEVCKDSTGERKTIYWQIGETANMISWEDYTVVTINGVTIDFSKDVYDCRDYPNYKYVKHIENQF